MIVRNHDDVRALREGGKRLSAMLHYLATLAKEGVSTQFLEDEARAYIERNGDTPAFLNYTPEGADRPYPAALCVSVNDAIVHGIPNEDPHILTPGDVVTLDSGLIHAGLITDSAITVCVGNPGEEVRAMLKAAYEALDAGIAAARVGNTIGDIGHAIERVANKHGLNYPYELGGHSVGLHVHEEPFVPNYGKPGSGPVLEEGMVLAIEPMFMLGKPAIKLDSDGYTYRTKDGSKAVHVEHTVLITAAGPEILTRTNA